MLCSWRVPFMREAVLVEFTRNGKKRWDARGGAEREGQLLRWAPLLRPPRAATSAGDVQPHLGCVGPTSGLLCLLLCKQS